MSASGRAREGAFTTAAQDRKGLLELPWDGTRRRGRGGRAGAGAVEMWLAQGGRRLPGSGRYRTPGSTKVPRQ